MAVVQTEQANPFLESQIDPQKSLHYNKGKWSLEGKSDREMTAALRNNFFNGDHVYIAMNDKIGDMMQVTAFLQGVHNVRQTFGIRNPVSLMVPSAPLREMFSPLCTSLGMDIIPSARMQSVAQADIISNDKGEKNSLIMEFDHYEGEPWVGRHEGNGTVVIRDIFKDFNSRYTNSSAGIDRYSRFIEDFLGLKNGTVDPEKALPILKLPPDAEAIYRNIVEKYRVDTRKKQVAIALEASSTGRMYDRWGKVVEQLIKDNGDQVEVNVIYNPNKPSDDPTRINEAYWRSLEKRYKGVKLVSVPLKEATVLLANQAVVLATDSGLSHIAGAIEGGPKVIPLYIPPGTDPDIWVTNPQRMFGISAPMTGRLSTTRGGDLCTDPKEKWVNLIPPEAIAKKAQQLMRTAYEQPSFKGSKGDAIRAMYQEILGRTVDNEGYNTYIDPKYSISRIGSELRNSPEKKKYEINRIYQWVLGRKVEDKGIINYMAHLNSGWSFGDIRKEVATSPENIKRLRPIFAINRMGVIDYLYKSILERDIDPDRRKQYETSTDSLETIMNDIVNSEEYKLGYQ